MTTLRPISPVLLVLLVAASLSATNTPVSARTPRLAFAAAADTSPGTPSAPRSDTLRFRPIEEFFDSTGHEPWMVDHSVHMGPWSESEWLRAPMGDHLLDHPDTWGSQRHNRPQNADLVIDYNRVDLVRYGLHYQAQRPETMLPRIGGRLEYATGRKTTMYGVQIEQPLQKTARFVAGVSMVRRTEHPELQLVEDLENSLALLFTRTDYRDYYEREGAGAYLSWRVPDFSTVSVHTRNDEYRSLTVNRDVESLFRQQRDLRENPAIDDGQSRSLLLRLERLERRSSIARAGIYHWVEFERSGDRLGGDFDYSRLLADVRSVVRLSPAASMSLRAVVGSGTSGTLPRQKRFGVGGVDGLRGHSLNFETGDQVALAQAEYTIGLWALRGEGFEAGLHAIAFADMGTAWNNPDHRWDVTNQRFTTDVGIGLASTEDDLRVYVARDLSDPSAEYVWSFRLQRPF